MSGTLPTPLRTRDRRQVLDARVVTATGEITGQVPMVGACRWRKDGQLLEMPGMTISGDQAGPLDLVLVAAGDAKEDNSGPRHASMAEALDDPAGRSACCD